MKTELIEDLFKIEPKEPICMSENEFVEKTKILLERVYDLYSKSWHTRHLKDEEHPNESICDKCTGRGTFLDNGEKKDCYQDKENGDCCTRFCDYEEVGLELETHIGDIVEILLVDKVITEHKQEPPKHICPEASHIECSCKDKCLRNINNYK